MKKNLFQLVLLAACLNSCSSIKSTSNESVSFADNNVIAHRGAWKKNNLPENSVAALRQAIELNCTGSEFDVRMTADDSLIVNHDPHYHNLSIEKSTYAELAKFTLSNGEKLPTLRSYIMEGLKDNQNTRLVCEIKPSETSKQHGQSIAVKVAELVSQLKAGHMVEYISFDYDILRKIIEVSPGAVTHYLNGDRNPVQLKNDGIRGADYNYAIFKKNPRWIDTARTLGIALNAWTVNDVNDFDWLLAHDFDFITTNEPELLFERMKTSPATLGWKLHWSDEFDYTGLPDDSKWNYDVGGHGWGNNEKQYYLEKSLENSYVADGILHIVALKKPFENSAYTSAKLTTYQRELIQYGKIEVMAKLPRGKGSWPAIWMLPETIRTGKEDWPLCGEIDIMEHVGKDPNVVHTSLHSELYNHVKGTQITKFDTLQNVFDNFHKYGIEWDENAISFFIDDELFFRSVKGQNGRVQTNEGWPFDKPYYLILNLAVGGNWGGAIDETIFPNEMQIDFVRIYKKGSANAN